MVLPTSHTETNNPTSTKPTRILLDTGLDTYEYSPTLRPPLPFQFPDPTAPGSEHDETIVRMMEEGRSWGDIERATGSNTSFDRYYNVLNPALEDSWTPVRIDLLSRVVQGHVDKWVAKQLFARPSDNNYNNIINNNNNINNSSVLVLNVEEHIPWSDVALAFQESGSVCTRIWVEFGNGRPLTDQGRQANQEMEASKEVGALKEKEDAQETEQAGRKEQSMQECKKLQGEVGRVEGLSQLKKDFVQTPAPSAISKTSEPTNGHPQGAPTIAPKPPSPTQSHPQYTPWRIQTSKLPPPVQREPTHPQPSNKGTGQGYANNYSKTTVRRTRLDSRYTKNKELETAQSLRLGRVLQNMQRIKLAGVQKSQIIAHRDRERVVLLEKQDAVKKQYDSLRVDSNDITSPSPTSRPIVFPRTLTTPFRPPLFPRYSVQSATLRVSHRDIDSSSFTSGETTFASVSQSGSGKEMHATDQPLPSLSGAPLDTPANIDTTTHASHNTPSISLPTTSHTMVEENFAELFQNGTGRLAPTVPTNTLSSGQKDSVFHVSSSNVTETLSGPSASLSELKAPSIADVLAGFSHMVDLTVGNKRHWAMTDEDAIKRLKAESEDIRSVFRALSSSSSSPRPPLGSNPTPPPP